VNTEVAKSILSTIKAHFGKKKQSRYISNRELSHDVDLSVYKLIDPKKKNVGYRHSIKSAGRVDHIYLPWSKHTIKVLSVVFHTLDSAISRLNRFMEDGTIRNANLRM
jgi:hypothetical protein